MTVSRNVTLRKAPTRMRCRLVAGAAAVVGVIGLSASDPALAESGQPVASVSQSSSESQRPNVIIILADDVGFSMTSAFGGPVPAPNIERLAREGIRYNRFNTVPRQHQWHRFEVVN